MIDLVQWFLLPSVTKGLKTPSGSLYGIETHHLEGLNTTNNSKVYAYHNNTGKSMWISKTPKGYPWDIKTYDGSFIYDSYTEADVNGWSDPHNYKQMGWPMLPRFWDGDPSTYVFHASAPWKDFNNCVQSGSGDVGPVYYKIEGPFMMDFGGDVGEEETILISYYWSDRKHREQLFLTQTAGWVKWTHALLNQLSPNISDYAIDACVIHNKIVLGTLTPQFPCYVIP